MLILEGINIICKFVVYKWFNIFLSGLNLEHFLLITVFYKEMQNNNKYYH